MKHFRIIALTALAFVLQSCTDLVQGLADIHLELIEIQNEVNRTNTSYASLVEIISRMDSDFILKVTPIEEDGLVIGYTIYFRSGDSVNVYHGTDGEVGDDGKDGKDGHSPIVNVKMDEDGRYYWVVDGEWMLDENGNKVPVTGNEGLTPYYKVENGLWYVSYDGKKTWNRLYYDTDTYVSPIESVDYASSEKYVIFHLTNGVTVRVRKYSGTAIVLECDKPSTIYACGGDTIAINFSVIGSSEPLDVEVKSTSAYKCSIAYPANGKAKLTISLPDSLDKSQVAVFINQEDKTWMKVFSFSEKRLGLSSEGCSNCYIVAKAGSYKFYALLKGKTEEHLDGDPVSAEVLWETYNTATKPSKGSLVRNVSYQDGYVSFSTAEPFKEGNAVIAVKDTEGKILWSWHLWLTNYNPDKDKVEITDGYAPLMDRNLGALSASAGNYKSNGLLYQGRRKDPFPGRISGGGKAATSVSWPSPAESWRENGNFAYVTSHPMVFLTQPSGKWYGWDYSLESAMSDMDYQVDPCPPGWEVPASHYRIRDILEYDDVLCGAWLRSPYAEPDTWFPAAGVTYDGLTISDSWFKLSGAWTRTVNFSSAYFIADFFSNTNGGFWTNSPAEGHAVRCCKIL